MVKERLMTDFVNIVSEVPQALAILEGSPGRVEEEALSWEAIASQHQLLQEQPKRKMHKDKKVKKHKSSKRKRHE